MNCGETVTVVAADGSVDVDACLLRRLAMPAAALSGRWGERSAVELKPLRLKDVEEIVKALKALERRAFEDSDAPVRAPTVTYDDLEFVGAPPTMIAAWLCDHPSRAYEAVIRGARARVLVMAGTAACSSFARAAVSAVNYERTAGWIEAEGAEFAPLLGAARGPGEAPEFNMKIMRLLGGYSAVELQHELRRAGSSGSKYFVCAAAAEIAHVITSSIVAERACEHDASVRFGTLRGPMRSIVAVARRIAWNELTPDETAGRIRELAVSFPVVFLTAVVALVPLLPPRAVALVLGFAENEDPDAFVE